MLRSGAVAVGALVALAAGAQEPTAWRSSPASAPGRIQLAVEYPPDGSAVNRSACGVFVAGRALAVQGETPRLDVAIVLDTSRSTSEPTGADLDRDGIVGMPELAREGPIFVERNSDPDDSVLAAEVAAARLLLRGLDPQRTRLAVVTFSGEAADTAGGRTAERSATTELPLTFDHARIDSALERIARREPSGNTDMSAGLDRATHELQSVQSSPGAEKVVIFFTDGQPTLPHGPSRERDNVLAVFAAADRAARAGIRVHSFAVGPDALDGPLAAVEMAARTSGSFTAVPDPAALPRLMGDVRFTAWLDVRLRNATTGVEAQPFRLAADGSWIGFVPMELGPNRVEVRARADAGTDALRRLEVLVDPSRPPPEMLERYVVQRNELLQICLSQQRELRVALEDRARKQLELEIAETRKRLRVEIERARSAARKRAAAQRKQLRIEVGPAR